MFKITFYLLVCLLAVSCSMGPAYVLRFALDVMDEYMHKNGKNVEKMKKEKKTVEEAEEDDDDDEEAVL
nr:hypothetical protein LKV13_05070 [Borrelia sp. BU AG58]